MKNEELKEYQMMKRIEALEKYLQRKFYQKKDEMVWGVKYNDVHILFRDFICITNIKSVIETIERIMETKVTNFQVKCFKDGKSVLKISFGNLWKPLQENPFKDSCLVNNPIELALIESKRKEEFAQSKKRFLLKLKQINKTRKKRTIKLFGESDFVKLMDDVKIDDERFYLDLKSGD